MERDRYTPPPPFRNKDSKGNKTVKEERFHACVADILQFEPHTKWSGVPRFTSMKRATLEEKIDKWFKSKRVRR